MELQVCPNTLLLYVIHDLTKRGNDRVFVPLVYVLSFNDFKIEQFYVKMFKLLIKFF